MRIFTKLFGGSRAKKIFEERDKLRRKGNALRQIGEAITIATDHCYKKTLPLISFTEENDKQSASIYIYYEYLYFFRHLVLRSAFSRLSVMQMKILHEYIAGIFIPHAIDTFLKQWPEELKTDMRNEFFAKLNDVEAVYGNSRELFTKKDPCTSDALTSKIGRNIAEITGNPKQSTTIKTAIIVITDAYKTMKLEKLIEKAQEDVYAQMGMSIQ